MSSSQTPSSSKPAATFAMASKAPRITSMPSSAVKSKKRSLDELKFHSVGIRRLTKSLAKKNNSQITMGKRSVEILSSAVRDVQSKVSSHIPMLLGRRKTTTIMPRDFEAALRLTYHSDMSEQAIIAGKNATTYFSQSFDLETPVGEVVGPDGKKKKQKSSTMASKANLNLDVTRIVKQMKSHIHGVRIGPLAKVFLAGAIEFILGDLIECSSANSESMDRQIVSPQHIQNALQADEVLDDTFRGAIIDNVAPDMQSILAARKALRLKRLKAIEEREENEQNNGELLDEEGDSGKKSSKTQKKKKSKRNKKLGKKNVGDVDHVDEMDAEPEDDEDVGDSHISDDEVDDDGGGGEEEEEETRPAKKKKKTKKSQVSKKKKSVVKADKGEEGEEGEKKNKKKRGRPSNKNVEVDESEGLLSSEAGKPSKKKSKTTTAAPVEDE